MFFPFACVHLSSLVLLGIWSKNSLKQRLSSHSNYLSPYLQLLEHLTIKYQQSAFLDTKKGMHHLFLMDSAARTASVMTLGRLSGA